MKFDQIVLSGTDAPTFDVNDAITLFHHEAPLSSPYVTRTVDGLGPTETDVGLAQSTQGVGIFIGRRPQLREITFNVNLNPDYTEGETPETLRENLYKMTPTASDGSLTLRLLLNKVEVARTPVYIKRAELTPFTKDNLLQLVLASPSNYLYRNTNVVQEPYLTDDKAAPIFVNEGSAPTGFSLSIRATGELLSFGLRKEAPAQFLNVVHAFQLNDILEIDTRIGSRGVWLTRNNVKTSLLGAMTASSTWLTLNPGSNRLLVMRQPSELLEYEWQKFEYQPRYLGV